MIIICDKCTTGFYIEEIQLLKERKLKCGKCSYVWLQSPFSLDDAQSDNHMENEHATTSEDKKTRLLHFIFWCLTALLVILLLMIPRSDIKPILRPFYGLFNVYDSAGVEFDSVRVNYQPDGVLIISTILNNSDEDKVLPNMKISMYDNKDVLLRVIHLQNYTRYIGAQNTQELHQHIANLNQRVSYITLHLGNKLELLLR